MFLQLENLPKKFKEFAEKMWGLETISRLYEIHRDLWTLHELDWVLEAPSEGFGQRVLKNQPFLNKVTFSVNYLVLTA